MRSEQADKLVTSPELKQIIEDSYGGIIYDLANQNKYDSEPLIALWEELDASEQESLGGVIKGAIDFIKGN